MMRKIISVVLALMMILSMFTTVSAATVDELITIKGINNPLDLNLAVEITAGRSGSGTYAADDLAIADSSAVGVNYITNLNMAPVRNLFTTNFITTTVAGDADALAEFNAGTVETIVDVTVTYPAEAAFAEDITLNTTGVLDAGSIFSEVSRTPGTNSITIRFSHANTLTVAELVANVNDYLKDIAFTLDDVVSYAVEGTYPVSVSLAGSTTVTFTSGTWTANYTGTDTHNTVYTIYIPNPSTRPDTYTITFNTNGGNEVAPVKVTEGDKLTAPTVTKEGYTFAGWYTDAALTDAFDLDSPIKRNMVLYAKWTEGTTPVDPVDPEVPMAPEDFDKFIDLAGYEWAETAINYLAYTGVIKGVTDTTYEPDMGIKRGDVALLMIRLFGLESDATEEFDDIEIDYYRDACRIGKAHGVLLGVNEDNTLYEPERIILREEMAALIVRSLVTMGHIDDPTDTDVSMYVDAEDIEAYAVPYIAYLTRMGIVQGDPDREFRPKDTITRAEAAQMLYNLYKLDVEGLLD